MNSDKLDITIIKDLSNLLILQIIQNYHSKGKNAENKLFYLIKGKVKEMIVNASKTERRKHHKYTILSN
jgi:hypothetical protein